jgi:hypothetical protein
MIKETSTPQAFLSNQAFQHPVDILARPVHQLALLPSQLETEQLLGLQELVLV